MGILEVLGLKESHTPADDSKEVKRLKSTIDTMQFQLEESIHKMEALFREDAGWQSIAEAGEQEMTLEGRRRAIELCRVMNVANPLIKRGLAVRAGYVFGQGVGIQAPDGTGSNRDVGTDKGQDINAVVQQLFDDPGNRRAFTGAQARMEQEETLGTDGNVYVVAFADKRTGFLRLRTLNALEVTDQISNPEDDSEPWFYRRDFVEKFVSERRSGRTQTRQRTVWYPAMSYKPSRRIPVIDGDPVEWGAALYHVRVNTSGKWGVPDAYAALPYARSYKEFLEDWARLMSALSRIAWRISGKRSSSQKARSRLQELPAGAGNVAAMDPETQLEAVPKTGATIDAESGRPLATMIAMALGLPVTMLLADPGATGARAVAETLDQPMQHEMQARREVWSEAYRAICGYAIDQAVLAPSGPLTGSRVTNPVTLEQEVVLPQEQDRTLTITWPDIEKTPIDSMVKAITDADATGKMPPRETMRLLLRALGVRDVDEILEAWTDEDGNLIDPSTSAGDAAVAAFQRGEDPAAAVRKQ